MREKERDAHTHTHVSARLAGWLGFANYRNRAVVSHHPDDKLVDVVWVAQLIDERKEHAARQHLLQRHPAIPQTDSRGFTR